MMPPRGRRGGLGLLAGALLLAPAGPALAADFPVYAEAVVFPLADGSHAVHVYLEAGPVEAGPFFGLDEAGGDLLVRFHLGGDGEEGEAWQRVASWGDSTAAGGLLWREELVRYLAPGRYEGEVEVEDLAVDRRGRAEFHVQIPEPGPGFSVSGLLLGTCDGDTATEDGVLARPSHVFHADREVVCALLRFAGNPEAADLRYEVRDAGGRTRTEGRLEVAPPDSEVVLRPHLDALPSGRYRLCVDAAAAGRKFRREADFELVGGVGGIPGDPLEARAILSYVATGSEMAELDRIQNADLPAFWDAFWARRDRLPETPTNEAEAEFLRRVEYATRHLGDMRPGWDTDRGEMYIRYGEPDRTEVIPGGGGRLPTRIWYYYDRNLTLVFQDLDGSGSYRLAANRRR